MVIWLKKLFKNKQRENNHYYNDDIWTKIMSEYFKDKLHKGESIYAEIVGYTPSGELIMPSVSNKKLEKFMDKEEYKQFISKYGDTTIFTYGCQLNDIDYTFTSVEKYKIFVYRITMTNEDGDSIDLSWEQVKRRCEQLCVHHVPELSRFIPTSIHLENSASVLNSVVNNITSQESKLFPKHIREGVCIRVENGNMTPLFLKNKSFIFKVLDSIIKESDILDIEDSQK